MTFRHRSLPLRRPENARGGKSSTWDHPVSRSPEKALRPTRSGIRPKDWGHCSKLTPIEQEMFVKLKPRSVFQSMWAGAWGNSEGCTNVSHKGIRKPTPCGPPWEGAAWANWPGGGAQDTEPGLLDEKAIRIKAWPDPARCHSEFYGRDGSFAVRPSHPTKSDLGDGFSAPARRQVLRLCLAGRMLYFALIGLGVRALAGT